MKPGASEGVSGAGPDGPSTAWNVQNASEYDPPAGAAVEPVRAFSTTEPTGGAPRAPPRTGAFTGPGRGPGPGPGLPGPAPRGLILDDEEDPPGQVRIISTSGAPPPANGGRAGHAPDPGRAAHFTLVSPLGAPAPAGRGKTRFALEPEPPTPHSEVGAQKDGGEEHEHGADTAGPDTARASQAASRVDQPTRQFAVSMFDKDANTKDAKTMETFKIKENESEEHRSKDYVWKWLMALTPSKPDEDVIDDSIPHNLDDLPSYPSSHRSSDPGVIPPGGEPPPGVGPGQYPPAGDAAADLHTAATAMRDNLVKKHLEEQRKKQEDEMMERMAKRMGLAPTLRKDGGRTSLEMPAGAGAATEVTAAAAPGDAEGGPAAPADGKALEPSAAAFGTGPQETARPYVPWKDRFTWHYFKDLTTRAVNTSDFEGIVMLLILGNCMTLALYRPRELDTSKWNQGLNHCDLALNCCFQIELIMRVIAAPSLKDYLTSFWNIFDVIMVGFGWLVLLPAGSGNSTQAIKAMRGLRALRPLRTITRVESLRAIVVCFLEALPLLSSVVGLFILLMMVFAIAALMLFMGAYKKRCFELATGLWEVLGPQSPDEFGCGGHRKCPSGFKCLTYTPDRGAYVLGFRNLGTSFLSVFQLVTLSNWSFIMYRTVDYTGWYIAIYYVILILFGSYFMVNMILAVLKNKFGKAQTMFENFTGASGLAKHRKRRNTIIKMLASAQDSVAAFVLRRRAMGLASSVASSAKSGGTVGGAEGDPEIPWYEMPPPPDANWWAKFRIWMARVVHTPAFEYTFMTLIILNTIALACQFYGMSAQQTEVLHIINVALTALFAVEVGLKMLGMGFWEWVSDGWNWFDALVTVVSIIDVAVSSNGRLSALRAFRVLRLFRLFRLMKSLRRIGNVLIKAMGSFASITSLILLFLFVFTVLGMHAFGYMKHNNSQTRVNFDTFPTALWSVFQVITLEDWDVEMYTTADASNAGAFAFFIIWVLIGKYILLTIFLAVTLEAFESKYDQEAIKDALKVKTKLEKSTKSRVPRLGLSRWRKNKDVDADKDKEGEEDPDKSKEKEGDGSAHDKEAAALRSQNGGLDGDEGFQSNGGRKANEIDEEEHGKVTVTLIDHAPLGASRAKPKSRLAVESRPDDDKAYMMTSREKSVAYSMTSSKAPVRPALKKTNLNQVVPIDAKTASRLGSVAADSSADGSGVSGPQDSTFTGTSSAARKRGVRFFRSEKEEMERAVMAKALEEAQALAEAQAQAQAQAQGQGQAPADAEGQGQGQANGQVNGQGPVGERRDSGPAAGSSGATTAAAAGQDSWGRFLLPPSVLHWGRRGLSRIYPEGFPTGVAATPGPEATSAYAVDPDLLNSEVEPALNAAERFDVDTAAAGPVFEGLLDIIPGNRMNRKLSHARIDDKPIKRKTRLEKREEKRDAQEKKDATVRAETEAAAARDDDDASSMASGMSGRSGMSALSGMSGLSSSSGNSSTTSGQYAAMKDAMEAQYLMDDTASTTSSSVGSTKRADVEIALGLREEMGKLSAKARIKYNLKHKFNPNAPPPYSGTSCFIFKPRNKFRQLLYRVVTKRAFDYVMVVFILYQCALMTLETPTMNHKSTLYKVMHYSDIILFVVFTLEAIAKIIAFRFKEYIRRTNNQIDFLIVVITGILIAIESAAKGATFLKGLRVLRAFKPLRILTRSAGMQLVMRSLILSITSIGNVTVIMLMFFVIFGILGVQLFGGQFYSCNDAVVETKAQCTGSFVDDDGSTQNREWKNYKLHFDNIFAALQSLFVTLTLDSYVPIVYSAMSARGVGKQPKYGANKWAVLYFIAFIMVVAFCMLNLYVGVVFYQFSRIRLLSQTGSAFLTNDQQEWVEVVKLVARMKPIEKGKANEKKTLKAYCLQIAEAKWFDRMMAFIVSINILFMCLNWDSEPGSWSRGQSVAEFIFTAIFCIEATIKIIGLGPRLYFKLPLNRLDFFIVIASIVSILVEVLATSGLAVLQHVAQLFRIARLTRVVRIIYRFKGMATIVNCFIISLPALWNVGALLGLLFFIYAYMGVIFFGQVERGNYLNSHTNFESFGMALIVLFRVATNDAWPGIMLELHRNKHGTAVAYPFFYSFVLLGSIIMFNLFTAVVIENYEKQSTREGWRLEVSHLEQFAEYWSLYDDGTGTISPIQLQDILQRLPPPIGLGKHATGKDVLTFVAELDIPLIMGRVPFHRTLFELVQRVSGAEIPEGMLKQQIDKMYARMCGPKDNNMDNEHMNFSAFVTVLRIQQKWRSLMVHRRINDRLASRNIHNAESALTVQEVRKQQAKLQMKLHEVFEAIQYSRDLLARERREAERRAKELAATKAGEAGAASKPGEAGAASKSGEAGANGAGAKGSVLDSRNSNSNADGGADGPAKKPGLFAKLWPFGRGQVSAEGQGPRASAGALANEPRASAGVQLDVNGNPIVKPPVRATAVVKSGITWRLNIPSAYNP